MQNCRTTNIEVTVVVMIVWYLDLQHAMQSVLVTTKVVSSNLVHGEMYIVLDTTCDKVGQ